MYGAFPNVSSVLGQAYDLFRQKIDQNDFLKAWWAERNQRGNSGDLTLEEMIAHVRTLGDQLGEEIAVAVTGSAAGPQDLIVLAGIQNRDGVLAEISALSTRGSGEKPVAFSPIRRNWLSSARIVKNRLPTSARPRWF